MLNTYVFIYVHKSVYVNYVVREIPRGLQLTFDMILDELCSQNA